MVVEVDMEEVTANSMVFELVPDELTTETGYMPTEATSEAGTVAVNCAALT